MYRALNRWAFRFRKSRSKLFEDRYYCLMQTPGRVDDAGLRMVEIDQKDEHERRG